MILIIHGNDIASSRNFYFEEKNKVKNSVVLNGENLDYNQLFQNAENKTFFEDKNALFIENFFSKNKVNTTSFKEIINYVNANKNLDIVFWENDEISKTSLSQLKNAAVKNFSFPQNLFLFLDNLKPGNGKNSITLFHEIIKNTEAELVFFMMIRQFRLLIAQTEVSQNQIDEVKRMAPWQISKFKKQLSYFDKKTLINLHNRLFEIELNHKTGKVPYSLEKSIDFFLIDL